MKFCILFYFFTAQAVGQVSKDSMDSIIKSHFSMVSAELTRYRGLTYYGETLSKSQLPDSVIDQEVGYYKFIIENNLISEDLPKSFLTLCHNLMIYRPAVGREFFELLFKPEFFAKNSGFFYTELIASEEYGEKLALQAMSSKSTKWRQTLANYLKNFAIYESSVEPLITYYEQEDALQIKSDIIFALNNIGSTLALPHVRKVLETTVDDSLQRAAIYAYAELTGYDGIKYLKAVKSIGPYSKNELKESIAWLKKETNSKNKYGTEIRNDPYFIDLYADLRTTSMIWLDKNGYLTKCKNDKPLSLKTDQRRALFEALVDSKGFGIEAVKGSLFQEPDAGDIPWLLKLRALTFYSPNSQSNDRAHSILILVRQLRRSKG